MQCHHLDVIDELDSYMYQTVGHHAIELYADAIELPLYRHTISGSPVEQGANYEETSNDEVEDLFQLLKTIQVRYSYVLSVSEHYKHMSDFPIKRAEKYTKQSYNVFEDCRHVMNFWPSTKMHGSVSCTQYKMTPLL